MSRGRLSQNVSRETCDEGEQGYGKGSFHGGSQGCVSLSEQEMHQLALSKHARTRGDGLPGCTYPGDEV